MEREKERKRRWRERERGGWREKERNLGDDGREQDYYYLIALLPRLPTHSILFSLYLSYFSSPFILSHLLSPSFSSATHLHPLITSLKMNFKKLRAERRDAFKTTKRRIIREEGERGFSFSLLPCISFLPPLILISLLSLSFFRSLYSSFFLSHSLSLSLSLYSYIASQTCFNSHSILSTLYFFLQQNSLSYSGRISSSISSSSSHHSTASPFLPFPSPHSFSPVIRTHRKNYTFYKTTSFERRRHTDTHQE